MNRSLFTKKTLIACTLLCSTLVLMNACNYPGLKKQPSPIPAKALQQTLQAQLAETGLPATTIPAQNTGPEIQPSEIPAGESPLPVWSNNYLRNMIGADGLYHYITQPGDTLTAIAGRFKLETWQISSPEEISSQGYLPPGQLLFIPPGDILPPDTAGILPDAEVVNSPTALGFNSVRFIKEANGFLSTYQEQVNDQMMTGAQIIDRVALESSINPRLLLAFLEYRSD
jgi:LasA protease